MLPPIRDDRRSWIYSKILREIEVHQKHEPVDFAWTSEATRTTLLSMQKRPNFLLFVPDGFQGRIVEDTATITPNIDRLQTATRRFPRARRHGRVL